MTRVDLDGPVAMTVDGVDVSRHLRGVSVEAQGLVELHGTTLDLRGQEVPLDLDLFRDPSAAESAIRGFDLWRSQQDHQDPQRRARARHWLALLGARLASIARWGEEVGPGVQLADVARVSLPCGVEISGPGSPRLDGLTRKTMPSGRPMPRSDEAAGTLAGVAGVWAPEYPEVAGRVGRVERLAWRNGGMLVDFARRAFRRDAEERLGGFGFSELAPAVAVPIRGDGPAE